jgi:catechol 2,3-dioxygenase-like lactoylglutathione lyase family enzyme
VPVTRLVAGTVTTSTATLDEVGAAYAEVLGWSVVADGRLPEHLADVAGVASAPRAVVLSAPASPRGGAIRFVEGDAAAPPPFATLGWSALELTVADVDALQERLAADGRFAINGPAADLVIGGVPAGLRAMQAVGPAGEQLYLTQVLRDDAALARPAGTDAVGALFIAVLSVRDVDAALSLYEGPLGMEVSARVTTMIGVASRSAGRPGDTTYDLAVARPTDDASGTRLELDGLPDDAAPRPRQVPGPPPGFWLATLAVDDLVATRRRLAAAGVAVEAGGAALGHPPYHGGASVVVRGHHGELVELVEPASP